MPSRNQAEIRRDINRLEETIDRRAASNPALGVLLPRVRMSAEKINNCWQLYQAASVTGDKERQERDAAIDKVVSWIQQWRPVTLLMVPGASDNIRQLPASGSTPDQVIQVAEDLIKFISTNEAAADFREQAQAELGTLLDDAKKENREAVAALPAETSARQAYSDACIEANAILIRGLEVIRAIFGRTSPEYKQFIARRSAAEEEEIDAETNVGNE
jgi:hypothetical protein